MNNDITLFGLVTLCNILVDKKCIIEMYSVKMWNNDVVHTGSGPKIMHCSAIADPARGCWDVHRHLPTSSIRYYAIATFIQCVYVLCLFVNLYMNWACIISSEMFCQLTPQSTKQCSSCLRQEVAVEKVSNHHLAVLLGCCFCNNSMVHYILGFSWFYIPPCWNGFPLTGSESMLCYI